MSSSSTTIRASAVFIALAAFSPACAEDLARIYVYAQRETPANSWRSISCGDAVVAEVKRGTFFAITVAAGRYVLGVEGGVPLAVDVRADEESFVRLDWNHQVDRAPIPALSKVRPPQAGKEMTYLSYINSKKIHSDSVARTDPRAAAQPRLKTRDEF